MRLASWSGVLRSASTTTSPAFSILADAFHLAVARGLEHRDGARRVVRGRARAGVRLVGVERAGGPCRGSGRRGRRGGHGHGGGGRSRPHGRRSRRSRLARCGLRLGRAGLEQRVQALGALAARGRVGRRRGRGHRGVHHRALAPVAGRRGRHAARRQRVAAQAVGHLGYGRARRRWTRAWGSRNPTRSVRCGSPRAPGAWSRARTDRSARRAPRRRSPGRTRRTRRRSRRSRPRSHRDTRRRIRRRCRPRQRSPAST